MEERRLKMSRLVSKQNKHSDKPETINISSHSIKLTMKYKSVHKHSPALWKNFIIMLTTLLSPVLGYSQGTSTQSKHNEQVVIIGSVDPSINQSYKINISPETPSMPAVNKSFDFKPINKYFYTPVTFKPIKPASIRAGKPGDMYNNIVKVGFGSRITPYVEFFHTQSHKGKFRFDAHLRHISTFGKIKEYSDAPSSSSLAEMAFSKFFRYHTLTIDGGYRYNTNRYYYPINEYPDDADTNILKQAYNIATFNILFASHYKNNEKLHHTIGLNTYYYFNKFKTSEMSANLTFDLHKSFHVTDLLEYQNLGIEGGAAYYGNNDSLTDRTDIYINATPYYKASYGIFRFKAGVNLAYLKADSVSKFRIYPDLKIDINLLPEYLQLYVGVDGGLKKNSFRSLSEENPFISSVLPDSWTNEKIGVYGGLKGNISKQVGFNVKVRWSAFEDDYFYNNNFYSLTVPIIKSFELNEFNVVLDSGRRFTADAQISYEVSDKLNLFASYQYNSYALRTYQQPIGKLLSQFKVGGSYIINKKFKPWLEVDYIGKRWTNIAKESTAPVELPGFADINIGMEYYYDKHFSGFIKATNLLNNHYQYYYLHPNYGLEVMIGISYKF